MLEKLLTIAFKTIIIALKVLIIRIYPIKGDDMVKSAKIVLQEKFKMALIKCSECQNEVSDKAKTCPNCGCPITPGQQKQEVNFDRNAGKTAEQYIADLNPANKIARRLNTIGNTLFTIVVSITGLQIIISVILIAKGSFEQGIGVLMLVIGVLTILIFFVIKTLFNGLAENIRILHDIRKGIRNSNINKESE